MLIALIGCVTIFQCHHHDASGHPFFLAIGELELTSGFHPACCGADEAEEHGAGEAPHSCGMHIDVANIDDNGSENSGVMSGWTFVSVDELMETAPRMDVITTIFTDDAGFVADGFAWLDSLRGPPCV